MEDDTKYKEVDFKKYCPLCKYEDLDDFLNPCDDCLTWPVNLGTSKPMKFMEKE